MSSVIDGDGYGDAEMEFISESHENETHSTLLLLLFPLSKEKFKLNCLSDDVAG